MDRPNVLFVMTDQHNHRALSCAGHPDVETPNIDRLTRSGLLFENAYCPSPVCGPSRASIFTGQYPRSHGIMGNDDTFENSVDLLPEVLQEAGYTTGLAGKLHLPATTAPHGFDVKHLHDAMYDVYNEEEPWSSEYVEWLAERKYDGDVERVVAAANRDENALLERHNMFRFLLGSNWRTEEEHSNTWVTEKSLEFLRNDAADSEAPFFLFTSYFGPHQPMLAPGRWAELYDPDDIELPAELSFDPTRRPCGAVRAHNSTVPEYFEYQNWSEEQYREVLAAYYGQISMIDHGIGRLLDELERQGIAEETVVVFTSDHGDHAGQFGWFCKGTMYEHSVRVPLIIRHPEKLSSEGTRTRRTVNNISLYETILDTCGVDRTLDSAGESLQTLIEDPSTAEWSDTTYSELRDTQMVVKDGLKIMRQKTPSGEYVYELYDVTEEPYDETNLWDKPEYQDRQEELFERLAAETP